MCLQECTVVGNGFLCLFPFLFAEEGFCCHESWSGIGFFRSSGSSEGISGVKCRFRQRLLQCSEVLREWLIRWGSFHEEHWKLEGLSLLWSL